MVNHGEVLHIIQQNTTREETNVNSHFPLVSFFKTLQRENRFWVVIWNSLIKTVIWMALSLILSTANSYAITDEGKAVRMLAVGGVPCLSALMDGPWLCVIPLSVSRRLTTTSLLVTDTYILRSSQILSHFVFTTWKVLSPFYREGNRGLGRLKIFPIKTQIVSNGTQIQTFLPESKSQFPSQNNLSFRSF